MKIRNHRFILTVLVLSFFLLVQFSFAGIPAVYSKTNVISGDQVIDIGLTKTVVTPGPYHVGDRITFKVSVINTGNAEFNANGVKVYDPEMKDGSPYFGDVVASPKGGWNGPNGKWVTGNVIIPPGGSVSITLTGTLLQSGEVCNHVYFVFSAQVERDDNPENNTAQACIYVEEPNPSISITKVADITLAAVGDTITYTYTVTNTGDVTLTSVTVNDDKLGSITLLATTLAPGASTTGTATYTVQESDLPGPIVNTATATGHYEEVEVTDTDSESVPLTYTALIEITKVADITLAAVGDTITYTYTVTNTGDVTLTSVTVNDDKLGSITLLATTLAPGASTTGTATYTVQESDLPGPIVNTATATGHYEEVEVTDTDSESVPLTYTALIEITKVADITLAAVGDTITYTYTVTNTGDVTLTGVTVNDDKLGSITLLATTLAPGASTTGTATYTVQESDLPGPIVNTATATGHYEEVEVTDTDSESVPLTYTALIEITKVADITLAAVGDTITYTYTVTNTGDVTLTSVTVNDDKLGSITLLATTLAPGASTTGTATYTVQESDLPGPIVNTATATGHYEEVEVTDTDSESVPLTYTALIEITKVADITLAAVGDTITYTYTVTNTGDVTLTSVTVNDDKLGSITLLATTLAPGASTTGTATYTVQESDLPGPIVNTATATGIDPDENSVTDTASESVTLEQPNASISITKVADITLADVGDTITYTYTVTNNGNVTLTSVTVNDDKLGSITLLATTLAPGASTTGTATYTVQESDLPGPIVNIATATGIDPDENSVTDTASESIALKQPSLPSISITKVADITLADVGDTITYTYTVKNNGNVTLNSITVNDDKLGSITLGSTTLAPGASTTGTATYTVQESDLPGPIVNTATAEGYDPSKDRVTDNASERVNLVQPGVPSISITKVANTALAAVGDTITYTYTITNTGDTVLNNITVNDDKLGSITLSATTLAPGASTTGTATYTVVEADLPGPIVNTATATGIDPDENSVTDSDTASVNLVQPAPSISITKVANTALAAVGDTITYTFTITNTGDTVLNNITVNDDKLGSITLSATTLAPGASTTGTATYTVQESDLPGPIVNTATATGIDPDENSVTDSDTASVALSSPQPLPEEEVVVYHHNFFSGYPDKTFRPENHITRAEVSSSVARALGLKWQEYLFDTFSYSFPDVTDSFWGFGHVEALFKENLIIGYPDGTFGPNRSITRAEAAQIFFRLLNLEQKYPTTPTFSDMDSSHWAYGAVEAIAEREVILGYPDGTFKPDEPITRAEFVTIACKTLGRGPFEEGIIENPYPDLKSTHWAFPFIMEASIPHVVLNPLRQDFLIVIPSKKIPIYSEWADSTIEVPELGSIIIAIVPVDGLTPEGNDPPPREVIVKIIVKREMP